jgi:hypothetical protein
MRSIVNIKVRVANIFEENELVSRVATWDLLHKNAV